MSLDLIPLVVTNLWLWGVIVIFIASMALSRSISSALLTSTVPRLSARWILALLTVSPLLTLVAGHVLWRKWEDPQFVPLLPGDMPCNLVTVLAYLQLLMVVLVVWRRRPMPLIEVSLIPCAIIWANACAFLSVMAVTGIWL